MYTNKKTLSRVQTSTKVPSNTSFDNKININRTTNSHFPGTKLPLGFPQTDTEKVTVTEGVCVCVCYRKEPLEISITVVVG